MVEKSYNDGITHEARYRLVEPHLEASEPSLDRPERCGSLDMFPED